MLRLMQDYFHKTGGKACCFEDLRPFLQLDAGDLMSWTDFLNSIPIAFASIYISIEVSC
jgi:N-terminal acetyltransferase B complex non-catalytic subunit